MSGFTPKPVFLALAVLALALVGGCGGGSSDTSTVGQEPVSTVPDKPSSGTVAEPDTKRTKQPTKAPGNQDRQEKNGKGKQGKQESPSKAAGGEPKDSVAERLAGLVGGSGAGERRVVSSPRAVRKVLRDLEERAEERDGQPGSDNSVEATLEKILGDAGR